MKKIILLIQLLFFTASIILAQNKLASNPRIAITTFNEQLGFINFKNDNPIHIGGAIAIGISRKQNNNYQSFNNLEIGYFSHENLFQAITLSWKPTYEWQFKKGFHIHGTAGVGYLHMLPTQQTYTQDNGVYQASNNFGKPSATASIGLGLGYQVTQKNNTPITIFTRYELTAIAPFNIYKDIPAIANTTLSLGVFVSPFN